MPSLRIIIGLLVFIIAVHALAMWNYWYWIFWWADIPMHFLGGIWLAMAFLNLNSKFKILNSSFFIDIILVLGFVALAGVLYEFIEFIIASYFIKGGLEGLNIFQSRGIDIYRDTLKDLLFDLIGGSAFALWALRKISREEAAG